MLRTMLLFPVCVVSCVCSAASAFAQPSIAWQPVGATVTHVIEGNTITLEAGGTGVEVTFEVRVSGWGSAPGNPELAAYQAYLISAGYDNGVGDPLNPKGWPDAPEDGAYIDEMRADFAFYGLEEIVVTAVDTATLDYGWGTAVFTPGSKADEGLDYYGGTLILEIPSGADGTYPINWDSDEWRTFLNDPNGTEIPGLVRVSGEIRIASTVVGKCCYDYPDSPSCADGLTESGCAELAGGTGYFYFPDLICAGTIDCGSVCNWHPNYCWDELWYVDRCRMGDCDFDSGECVYWLAYDSAVDCCNSGTGALVPIEEGTECIFDYCLGYCRHTGEPCATDADCSGDDNWCLGTGQQWPMPYGTPCAHADACVINEVCDGYGTCQGDLPQYESVSCSDDGDCPTGWFCNLITRMCDCPLSAEEARKNRYISFMPDNSASLAYQVEMTTSLYFPGSTGVVGWVDEPDENGIARIASDPFYSGTWPGVVHVGDCWIIPAATYEIRSTPDGDTFGDPVEIGTIQEPTPKRWGDVVGSFAGSWWTPPNRVVNMDDVMAAIQKFKGEPGAPPLIWVDVDEEVPNGILNFTDIMRIVQGFKAEPYPFRDPAACP